jgi:hypothetical protein
MKARIPFVPLALLIAAGLGAGDAKACNGACWQEVKLSPVALDGTKPVFGESRPSSVDPASSFRGLRLGITRREAESALQAAGFSLRGIVPDDPNMDICEGTNSVGSVRFDAAWRVKKLALRPGYFAAGDAALREFADQVFAHYNVAAPKLEDDTCFPGLTCFKGLSAAGERFILFSVTRDVQLHVVSGPGVD